MPPKASFELRPALQKADHYTFFKQTPHLLMPKLFGKLKTRYANRPGGYTRVLRTEPKKDDQAQSAVLELVDGPYDMRFAITAAAVGRDRELGREHSELTLRNRAKVTRYRRQGDEAFEAMVLRTQRLNLSEPGLQLADVEPIITLRSPEEDETLKRAKPVHNYWNSGDVGAGRRGSARRGTGSPGSLARAIGDPGVSPSH